MPAERIIGVDFGTSTSVIRVKRYKDGKPIGERLDTKEVNFNGFGSMVPTLIRKKDDDPSVVYYGYEARNGKKKTTLYQGFKVSLENRDPEKRAMARALTEEFLSYMAKQYRAQSDGGHLGEMDDKEKTIISYPVKWSEETRRFMVEAAKKAGFPNVTGMDEAQAAIQAAVVQSTDYLTQYGLLHSGTVSTILLIDMGAGTTDLVLCKYIPSSNAAVEILNTWPKNGKILFGGQEIDMRLPGFFRGFMNEDDFQRIIKGLGTDKFKSWKEEMVSPALLRNDTVSDFEALESKAEAADIEIDDWCLDRGAFENCLSSYLNQLPALINDCVSNASVDGNSVDLVIVTGGHSQWYFVKDMLSGRLTQYGRVNLPKIIGNPQRIIPISRPQETVALGLVYSGIEVKFKSQEPAPEVIMASSLGITKEVFEEKRRNTSASIIQTDTSTTASSNGADYGSMLIENTNWIPGKGLEIEGRIQGGPLSIGQEINVFRQRDDGIKRTYKVIEIRKGQKSITAANVGDVVCLLLQGASFNSITKGDGISYEIILQKLIHAAHSIDNDQYIKDTADVRNQDSPLSNFEFREVEGGYEISKFFKRDNHFEHVKIPDTYQGKPVIGIGKSAFSWARIDIITFPKGCQYIGKEAFSFSDIPNIIFNEGLRIIEESAFSSANYINRLMLPDTLQKIGARAFDSCLKLKKIYLGKNLESIGHQAFHHSGIESIEIPASCQQIGKEAFRKCYSLKSILIPRDSKLTKLYEDTFMESSISKLTLPKSVRIVNRENLLDGGPELKPIMHRPIFFGKTDYIPLERYD